MTALVTRRLTKLYGGVPVVDKLDLSIERGELYGFLGPNGAGKTTTIRMVLGLIFPSEGEVDLLGGPVFGAGPPEGLARTGAMIEEPGFYKYLSGRKNLEVFVRAGGRGEDTRRRLARIDEVLALVGLADAAGRRVKTYSQGMRQRLGIALALVGEPAMLVLDEPTNGLDPSGMREVRQILRRLTDGGTTVFVSSHLLSEVEAMCDRVGVLSHGRLVAEGPPGALRGTAERVRVEVDDVEGALRALAPLEGVRVAAGELPGTVVVHLAGEMTAALANAVLVSAGVAVNALIPERDTLEDVFLALVEDDDVRG